MHANPPRNHVAADRPEPADGAGARAVRRRSRRLGQRLPDERKQPPAVLRPLGQDDDGRRLGRDVAPRGAAERGRMNEDVLREVEQFLYREARLLDERRFNEWLALLTDDIHYWVGARSNRYPRRSKAISILDPERYVEDDMPKADELAILDEDRQTLGMRVERLDTGMAWAEDPPSRTRHLITNIEVAPGSEPLELQV